LGKLTGPLAEIAIGKARRQTTSSIEEIEPGLALGGVVERIAEAAEAARRNGRTALRVGVGASAKRAGVAENVRA
jgi:hypothetical protein